MSDLSAKREALLAELKQVEDALSQARQEESQLPETIKHLEQERNVHGRKALQLKRKLKPIEGSPDDDIKEIETANQIRLRAISAIQALLNIWSFHRQHTFVFLLLAFSLADKTVIGIFWNIKSTLEHLNPADRSVIGT